MPKAINDDVAGRWYDYWRRFSGSREERKALEDGQPPDVTAAYEWVSVIVERGGVTAVQVLAALADAAPDGDNGVTVGVGPVEDLLFIHGDKIVDVLLDEARRTPALALALAHVTVDEGSVSRSSLAKLERYKPR